MINSKQDLRDYLTADFLSSYRKNFRLRPFVDDIWKFQILLRKVEYYQNCRKDFFGRIYWIFLRIRLERMSVKLGFSIPPNSFGPGLSIAHRGTIVIHGKAKIGANCRIHVCVNIGAQAGDENAVPKIGDNVYIGPGAKIFGGIEIADGIAIGANAVVNKSFTEPNISIAGVPAKKINNRGSEGLLKKGYGPVGEF